MRVRVNSHAHSTSCSCADPSHRCSNRHSYSGPDSLACVGNGDANWRHSHSRCSRNFHTEAGHSSDNCNGPNTQTYSNASVYPFRNGNSCSNTRAH